MEIDYTMVGSSSLLRVKKVICFAPMRDMSSSARAKFKYVKWRPPNITCYLGTKYEQVINEYLGKVSCVYPEMPDTANKLEKYGITVNIREHTYYYMLACMSWARRLYEEREVLPDSLYTMMVEWGIDTNATLAWTSRNPLVGYYNYPGHFIGSFHADFAHTYKNAQAIEKGFLDNWGPFVSPSAAGRARLNTYNEAEQIIRGAAKANLSGEEIILRIRFAQGNEDHIKELIRAAALNGEGYNTVYTERGHSHVPNSTD